MYTFPPGYFTSWDSEGASAVIQGSHKYAKVLELHFGHGHKIHNTHFRQTDCSGCLRKTALTAKCYNHIQLLQRHTAAPTDRFLATLHQGPIRSSSQSRSRIPSDDEGRRKKHFGFRNFSYSTPWLQNVLPETVRECTYATIFRRHLKTHLFSSEC